MKVISICSNKGGVGKTTVAFNIACGLSSRGKGVICIDLDKQKNLTKILKNCSYPITILDATTEELGGILANGDYFDKVVIVDCPPALNRDVARVLNISDYLISPVRPDTFSIDAISRVQSFLKESGARARLLAIPVNGTKNTTVSKMVVGMLEKKTKPIGVPVVSIKDNSKVVEGLFIGKPIIEYKKNPSNEGYQILLDRVMEVV